MSDEQFATMIALLKELLEKNQSYTLTGAADWPLLVALSSALFVLIGLMWTDLRTNIRENKTVSDKQNDIIWAEFRRCQSECRDIKSGS